MKERIRVVVARLGMDAHWRGSIVVARALRDAGMEVIYLGNQMPEQIVETAMQEDADVIGLSTLSGNHMVLAPAVMRRLREKGNDDIVVILGGTVSPDDVPKLKGEGIAEVFGPGSSLNRIVRFVAGLKETPQTTMGKDTHFANTSRVNEGGMK
ncbi:MAG: cobalamin B12-binding domain-containing protein [Desulfobacteraceae bacterium]|jgi:methylmalonyl-CoA mutase C-terminal domain/subunit